jgi:hypothetical protein
MRRLTLTIAAIGLAMNWSVTGETKVDFAKDIQPILQENCVRCHGPEKQKAKLRLDSREAMLKGGKDGAAVVPGDAEKSELYRRITLPKGNDDLMPNEGDPLPKALTDLIRDWINQGADWPDTAAPRKTSAAAALPPGPVLSSDFKASPAEAPAIAAIAQHGVEVSPIAMNTVWREANFRQQGTNVTDVVIAPLREVASLVDLNLATTKITDAGLANLEGLTNLMRLHLELTPISDAGLEHLKGLANLTYLNLYGTQVTDAGLEHLQALKHLRHLYLWQSKVTQAGVKNLKAALPNLDISTGWDLTTLAKKEEPRPEKKAEEAEKKAQTPEKKPEDKKAEKPKKPADDEDDSR